MSESRIYYSEALVQSFENSLRKAYSPPFVQLSRRPSKGIGRFNVVIASGTTEFQAANAESAQKLIGICGDRFPPEIFWVAFKANFELWEGGKHFLEHISVSVFQRIEAGDLIRMFRAEWDSRAAGDSSFDHAQPHWHFAMEVDDFRAVLRSEEPLVFGQRNTLEFGADMLTPMGLVDFSGFHFAMSPLWHKGAPACYRQIIQSDEELCSWFDNLSTYIAEQLAYVSKKMGVGPSIVRDFR